MADEQGKSKVFTVSLDFTNLKNQQDAFAKTIQELSAQQRELDATTEDGRKQYAELGKQLRVVEGQMKLNQKAINTLTADEKANTDAVNFNNNSIKQNRELLKNLSAEYIRLQNPTKEQTKQVKDLTDTLKKQEAAIGDNRRNVGNYGESIRDVVNQLPGFSKGLDGLKNGFTALTASNPFGLILAVLSPLIQSFLKLEPVTNTINGIFEAIAAVVTTITSTVKNFFDLVSSGQGIFSSLADSFSGFGNKIVQSASQAYNLVQALDELEDAQRANQNLIAQTNRDTAILIAQSKDRTKSERERIGLLEQANELEEKQLKRDLRLANLDVKVKARDLQIAILNGTKDRDAAEQALADSIDKRFQIEQSFGTQTEKSQGRINALIQSGQDIREKAADKRAKADEKQKADEEKKLAELKKRAEEAAKIFEDTTKAEFEFTKKATDAFYEQQLADLQTQLATQQLTQEEFDQQSLEIQQEKISAQLLALADYNGTVGDMSNEIAAKEIEFQNLVTKNQLDNLEKEKKAKEKASDEDKKRIDKVKAAQLQFAQETSDTFSNALLQQGDFLKNALKGFSLILIESLEKELIATQTAAIAKATIGALTTPDSILTFGSTGLLRATALIALIKTAFGFFKSKISAFAGSGLVEDIPGFAGSGLSGTRIMPHHGMPIKRSNGDNRLATVAVGEVVLNKYHQRALGGPSTFARIGVPGFADSGLIGARSAELNLPPDQSALIQAVRNIKVVASVEEFNNVDNRIKFMEEIASI